VLVHALLDICYQKTYDFFTRYFPRIYSGFFQVGFGFIFITMGARSTSSAMVGIIMLSESVLGPMWAFLFVSERPSLFTLIGGSIILFAVLLQFYALLFSSKKKLEVDS